MKTREMVTGGMLVGLSMLIPLAFGGIFSIKIPPFTATLGAHVPTMLAMLISPKVAALTGLGSALGFMFALGLPVVGARASVHMVWGFVGGVLVRKGMPFWLVLLVIAPLHAVMEALIVLPFGFSLYDMGVVVGIGTLLHHLLDSTITLAIYAVIGRKALGWAAQKQAL